MWIIAVGFVRLVVRFVSGTLVDIVKDLLALNEDVMGVFLPDGLTVHEYVLLLPQQIRERLQVDALVPHPCGEELGDLPEGGECVQSGKVRRVEEVEGRKFTLFFKRLKFFL